MLHFFHERHEARHATRARRIYNRVSAAVLVAVGACLLATVLPVWIFLTVIAFDCLLDAFLIRKWIREDTLRAHRAYAAADEPQERIA